MAYNLTAEGPEQNRGYAPPYYPVAPVAPAGSESAAPAVSMPDFRPNITGAVSEGGGVSRYRPQSVAETQQTQLLAAQMGLDLAHYKQFGLNPAKFVQQFGQYRDPTTGMFKIPDVTPGALISTGGAIKGPNGETLAAGTTPGKPIDLASITRSRIEHTMPGAEFIQGGNLVTGTEPATKAKNFLPPYLQPKQTNDVNGVPQTTTNQPPTATPVPQTETVSPITPSVPQMAAPVSPLAPSVPPSMTSGAKSGSFAKAAKILELPYYLRGNYANR